MNRQFAINLRDGRVVLCTRETLLNIDYYAISEKVAMALESGLLNRKEVIAKIKGKLLTNQEEWDALLEKKTTQNVRHSDIKPETTEVSETRIEKEEVKEEFDMPIPGAAAPAPAPAPAQAPAPQVQVPDATAPAAPAPAPAPKVTNHGGGKRGNKSEQNPFEAQQPAAADAGNGDGEGLEGLGE